MKNLFALLILATTMVAAPAFAGLKEDRAEADAYLKAGDEKKAFKAYRDLARDGDHDSQFTLAEMYATGVGTKTDMIDAYAWSVVAAESGNPDVSAYAEKLLSEVDNKDKAERAALKLVDKYGKAAQDAKAERLARQGSGQRFGACTGSRLSCNARVEAIKMNGSETGAPPVAEGGN